MINSLKSRNLYKLIVFIFLLVAGMNIKSQLVTLKLYNNEISSLNEKIAILEEQVNNSETNLNNSRKENEDIARKDLRMYYPNETPYKGY